MATESNDPLDQLRDIHLPAEPSWWPPAPGWWFVAAVTLLALAWFIIWLRRFNQRRRPARAARQALREIEADYQQNGDAALATRRLSILLRRYLLARFDRPLVAGLSGEDWALFVQRHHGLKDLDRDQLAVLLDAPYRREGGDAARMIALVYSVIGATGKPPRRRRESHAKATLHEPSSVSR
jgi:hypothetical protein